MKDMDRACKCDYTVVSAKFSDADFPFHSLRTRRAKGLFAANGKEKMRINTTHSRWACNFLPVYPGAPRPDRNATHAVDLYVSLPLFFLSIDALCCVNK